MKQILLWIMMPVVLVPANAAFASRADYCAAYAQDFADAKTQDKTLWQHKYDIAHTACMVEAQPAVQANRTKTKIQTVQKPVQRKTASLKPSVNLTSQPTPATNLAKTKLEVGSGDWNTFCANKYTSFNVKTGTYTSHTGVERKCVISAP